MYGCAIWILCGVVKADVVVCCLLFVVCCSDSNITQLSDRDEKKLRPHWGNGGHGDHH